MVTATARRRGHRRKFEARLRCGARFCLELFAIQHRRRRGLDALMLSTLSIVALAAAAAAFFDPFTAGDDPCPHSTCPNCPNKEYDHRPAVLLAVHPVQRDVQLLAAVRPVRRHRVDGADVLHPGLRVQRDV